MVTDTKRWCDPASEAKQECQQRRIIDLSPLEALPFPSIREAIQFPTINMDTVHKTYSPACSIRPRKPQLSDRKQGLQVHDGAVFSICIGYDLTKKCETSVR